MASERRRQRIERLLDEAEEAVTNEDWSTVASRARSVLAFDPDNADALDLITASHRALPNQETVPSPQSPSTFVTSIDQPTSFANGRYEVKRFLGEGGKKKVYLAQDTLLDREVAFALIKTEGLDEVSRTRITREAQAMGRLGSHPHIVSVLDLGQHQGQHQKG